MPPAAKRDLRFGSFSTDQRCLRDVSTRSGPNCCITAIDVTGQLETSCRVPGHGLHGRECIAVAADSAAKIKNTEPGPLAIIRNNDEPYAVPTGRSFDGKGDANDEEQRR